METNAQKIVDDAHGKVCELLDDADQQINEIKLVARAAGEREGAERAGVLLDKLEAFRQSMLLEANPDITQLAFEVASKMLAAEFASFPESVVRVAQEVLASVPDAQHVYFRANPQDVELLKESKARLIDALAKAKDVDIRSDKRVARGGLLVQTEFGVIDAQLTTQIEELSRAVIGG